MSAKLELVHDNASTVHMIRLTTKDDGLPLDIYNPRENVRAVWEVEEGGEVKIQRFGEELVGQQSGPEVVTRVECSADGTAFRVRESAEEIRHMIYPEFVRPFA